MVSAADILNARILIVDDKEANVRLIEGMLRVAGYSSVESTTDPNEVFEHLRGFGQDLHMVLISGTADSGSALQPKALARAA